MSTPTINDDQLSSERLMYVVVLTVRSVAAPATAAGGDEARRGAGDAVAVLREDRRGRATAGERAGGVAEGAAGDSSDRGHGPAPPSSITSHESHLR